MSTIYFYFGYRILSRTSTLLFVMSKTDVQVLTVHDTFLLPTLIVALGVSRLRYQPLLLSISHSHSSAESTAQLLPSNPMRRRMLTQSMRRRRVGTILYSN